jgi:hypothetical protein
MPSSLRRFAQSLILCAACSVLVPSSAFGQSLKEQLAGTWLLVAWTNVVAGVEEPGMMGRDPIGQVMFAPDGHMCFSAMRSNRSKFGSRDFRAGTPEEKTTAYDSYVGYLAATKPTSKSAPSCLSSRSARTRTSLALHRSASLRSPATVY